MTMHDADTALAFALRADERHAAGDAEAARASAQEALSRRDDTSPEAHPRAETCLGLLAWAAGEPIRCREHFERAASLRKAWPDGPVHSLIGALDNLALIQDRTGDASSALDLRRQALSLAETRTPDDLVIVRRLRRRLGQSIADAGDNERALDLYMRAEPAPDDPLQDKIGWANALALLAERRGEWTEAGRWYEAAVAYVEACGPETPGVAHAAGNAAIAWIDLGAYGRAAPMLRLLRNAARFDRTLATRQSLLDVRAHALTRRGRFAGALRVREAADALATAAGLTDADEGLVRAALRVQLLGKVGRPAEAERLAEKALAAAPERSAAAVPLLVATAELRIKSGAPEGAVLLLSQALVSALGQPDPAAKSHVLAALAEASGGRSRAAILLGKIGIEYVRLSGSSVGPAELEDWLAPRLEAYDRTLDRLTLAGRLPEALRLQIRRLREAAESVARSGDGGTATLGDPVPYRQGEQDMRARLAALELALRPSFAADGEPAPPNETAAEGVRIWLDDVLAERFDAPSAAPREEAPHTPPAGTGAISFLPAGGGYCGALRTAQGLICFDVPMAPEDLARNIRALRHACVEETEAWRAPAQALHAALVAPVREALRGLTRLDILASGAISFIPFAALHDGDRFLVERLVITMRTGCPAPSPARTVSAKSDWRAVAFGRSQEEKGLGALEGTLREIERLGEHLSVKAYLDESFTARNLRRELADAPQLVHIATHFRYEPGRPHASELSLGPDERLALSSVAGRDYSFAGVELLVLACCDTAVTDSLDLGVESLAGLAQLKGVAAVVASAWPVADAGAERLMTSFYRHFFAGGRDVAAALAAAQREVGGARSPAPGPSRGGGIGSARGGDMRGHPGAWAGFSAYLPSP